ncbi:RNA polymerase sigma factor [Adhaeribacter radiodurans]|uniref:Sigma-70 family RNA polymerase sigma factor n=1 Tax=Adhaeribacter radiodurans TaxID=2745197 RepID=A0A7L7LAS3_9BACT|nr:sigma-70 family RNA polymerase sigma factor [Adhaeribacter radiodurans]QMU29931.1 sigma-70 family RNA polymerase sigma factor [Adhaeribacter radiodurans]
MKHPDQKYIEALLKNDRILLDELYSKFSGKIKRMILRNSGTEADAADVFNDALLSLYYKASNQNFELTCPLDAFLYLICKNKWINELNKKKNKHLVVIIDDGEIDLGEDSFKLAEDYILQEQRHILLLEKVAELGDACKQLLHLSWSGKSMEEVAQILRVSYGFARKKKSGCIAKLIALMKQSSQFNSLKW